jgi:hypothetical protein
VISTNKKASPSPCTSFPRLVIFSLLAHATSSKPCNSDLPLEQQALGQSQPPIAVMQAVPIRSPNSRLAAFLITSLLSNNYVRQLQRSKPRRRSVSATSQPLPCSGLVCTNCTGVRRPQRNREQNQYCRAIPDVPSCV